MPRTGRPRIIHEEAFAYEFRVGKSVSAKAVEKANAEGLDRGAGLNRDVDRSNVVGEQMERDRADGRQHA